MLTRTLTYAVLGALFAMTLAAAEESPTVPDATFYLGGSPSSQRGHVGDTLTFSLGMKSRVAQRVELSLVDGAPDAFAAKLSADALDVDANGSARATLTVLVQAGEARNATIEVAAVGPSGERHAVVFRAERAPEESFALRLDPERAAIQPGGTAKLRIVERGDAKIDLAVGRQSGKGYQASIENGTLLVAAAPDADAAYAVEVVGKDLATGEQHAVFAKLALEKPQATAKPREPFALAVSPDHATMKPGETRAFRVIVTPASDAPLRFSLGQRAFAGWSWSLDGDALAVSLADAPGDRSAYVEVNAVDPATGERHSAKLKLESAAGEPQRANETAARPRPAASTEPTARPWATPVPGPATSPPVPAAGRTVEIVLRGANASDTLRITLEWSAASAWRVHLSPTPVAKGHSARLWLSVELDEDAIPAALGDLVQNDGATS